MCVRASYNVDVNEYVRACVYVFVCVHIVASSEVNLHMVVGVRTRSSINQTVCLSALFNRCEVRVHTMKEISALGFCVCSCPCNHGWIGQCVCVYVVVNVIVIGMFIIVFTVLLIVISCLLLLLFVV